MANSNVSRILSLAGLCRRAGGVVPGADAVVGEMRRGGKSAVRAVLLASDASERTTKMITDKTAHYQIRLVRLEADSFDIGLALGIKASCAVFALNGRGPSAALIEAAFGSDTQ